MNKIQKIKAEIDRLQSSMLDENSNFRSLYDQGIFDGLSLLENFIDPLEMKEVDEQKERMSEYPYRKVGCTMYEGTILECNGACSWVVDYQKLKELKAQKGE